MFADVRELPGAHLAEVLARRADRRSARCGIGSRQRRSVHDLPFAAAVDQFRDLLEQSVRLHLRSDVPLGLLLSGGQDSSSLLALARRTLGSRRRAAHLQLPGPGRRGG